MQFPIECCQIKLRQGRIPGIDRWFMRNGHVYITYNGQEKGGINKN